MASSQMHYRWSQQLHSPKHIWIMAFSTLSVTDVDLTNLIIACSIPWPILVNGVPEVFRNQTKVYVQGEIGPKALRKQTFWWLLVGTEMDVCPTGGLSSQSLPRSHYPGNAGRLAWYKLATKQLVSVKDVEAGYYQELENFSLRRVRRALTNWRNPHRRPHETHIKQARRCLSPGNGN